MELPLLRVFQRQVLLQCQFIHVAGTDLNTAMVEHDNLRVFSALQSLLTSTANISKALWGQSGRKTEQRAALRASIGIEDASPLNPTTMRNHFDHFDERLDDWWRTSPDHNYVDLNIAARRSGIAVDEPIDWFRNFDPGTAQATFWGDDFNLREIVAEVNRILPKLSEEANKPHWKTDPEGPTE